MKFTASMAAGLSSLALASRVPSPLSVTLTLTVTVEVELVTPAFVGVASSVTA